MSEIMSYHPEQLKKISLDEIEVGYACPDCGEPLVMEEETAAGDELYCCFCCFVKVIVIA